MYENKKYLDSEGLKALIIKIAEIWKAHTGVAKDVSKLIERVDEIYKVDEKTGDVTGILKDVRDLADQLRAELGEAKDTKAADFKSVYARLDEIEKAAAELEPRVAKVEKESVAKLTSEYKTETKEVVVTAKNAAGEDLADATFTINTTDFVVDGMISKVIMVTAIKPEGYNSGVYVVNDDPAQTPVLAKDFLHDETKPVDVANGPKLWTDEDTESQVWWEKNEGKKFILMRFNTSVKGEHDTAIGRGYKDILIDTQILFNDTEYSVENEAVKYFGFDIQTENASKDDNNVLSVVYKVSLTDAGKKTFELVNGEAKDATGAIIRGVEKLHEDLGLAEKAIEEIKAKDAEQDETITALDGRVTTLEETVQGITKFIEEGAIKVPDMVAVFDYYVYGIKNPPLDGKVEWFKPEEDFFEADGGKVKPIEPVKHP